MARKRARWRELRRRLDPDRSVFVDEIWIKTNMAPLRGWAPKGHRLKGFAPHGRWRTLTFLTFLACLRRDGLRAPCVFDGPINWLAFQAWVGQHLVPTLRPGDLVGLYGCPHDCKSHSWLHQAQHGLAVLYSACGCDRSSEGSLVLMDSADRFPIS